ncbi:hypothetical protein CB0940_10300 [Cercospora beticola]|uniref:Uncharacterized protein n=1 Tax=Cercospora beticola TaxID=122368 RepID=A0A2G5HUA8_CERBT|nr:hypothetical protein CB0940_10300 [Cercospora beticola]PIA96115.1 hypothetical protein CB0940_10300 [Cercospora beticola]WPB07010.1 hypothetical protein RHO25_011670 [Cercospora beticola]CAK1366948.1 unnamed protein product [Cercospora beticola]
MPSKWEAVEKFATKTKPLKEIGGNLGPIAAVGTPVVQGLYKLHKSRSEKKLAEKAAQDAARASNEAKTQQRLTEEAIRLLEKKQGGSSRRHGHSSRSSSSYSGSSGGHSSRSGYSSNSGYSSSSGHSSGSGHSSSSGSSWRAR